MHRTRRCLVAVVALASLLALAPAASAAVVRLRSGETLKGTVVRERSNEQVLCFDDYVAGVKRELSWEAIDPVDAANIKRELGIIAVADVMLECLIVEYRLDDGTVVRIKGEFVKEEGGFLFLKNVSQKEPLRVPSNRVVTRTKGECDPGELYPPEELAEKHRAESSPEDARGWFSHAQFCEAIGAYAAAKEAYENAAADETYLNRKAAQDAAARCDSILRDAEAVTELYGLKLSLSAAMWKRVREGLDGFTTKHPSIGDATKKKFEEVKKLFATKRTQFFCAFVGRRFEPIMLELIRKKAAPKDTDYNTMQGWLRKEALEQGLEQLLAEAQKLDGAVTAEELKTFWEGRPKNTWRTARYGSGTRFIFPPQQMPKTGVKQTTPQKNQGNGPAPVLKLPEPPSRDDWWRDLSIDQRVAFWWAVFVEKSTLFEVDPKHGRVMCDRCQGDGVKTYMLSNGMQATTLCERCAGARFDQSVKYR